ncbi:MAG: restriction endonuclease subunit S [Paludibacteraceae bacterium]|nr:restriction endonuclease subunit S [Paludibacteraceae bacterium]
MDTSSWKTININEIFDISYGNKLDMCQMTPNEDGIPFVTRTATNNGVGGIVEPIDGVVPYPAESLSIALGGSIGSTFLQTKDFYTSQNVAVLQPKTKLSNDVLLFLSVLVEKECNQRFVAFGRELNKHIKRDFTIKLPVTPEGTPDWKYMEDFVKDQIIPQLPKKAQKVWLQKYDTTPQKQENMKLNTQDWKWFRPCDIFTEISIAPSSDLNSLELDPYGVSYLSRAVVNNGYECKVKRDENKVTKGNFISVVMVGVPSFAFYQANDVICSQNILVLRYPSINQYNALFLSTILQKDGYRYSYGRTLSITNFLQIRIKLPVTPSGEPDWQFMEDYIKSLPFSRNIEPSKPNEVVDELVEMKKEMIKMRRAMEAQQTAEVHYHIDQYHDYSTNYNIKK